MLVSLLTDHEDLMRTPEGALFARLAPVTDWKFGRGEWIRTTDLLVPNQAL